MWKGEEDLRELGGEDCNQNILSEKNPSSIKKKVRLDSGGLSLLFSMIVTIEYIDSKDTSGILWMTCILLRHLDVTWQQRLITNAYSNSRHRSFVGTLWEYAWGYLDFRHPAPSPRKWCMSVSSHSVYTILLGQPWEIWRTHIQENHLRERDYLCSQEWQQLDTVCGNSVTQRDFRNISF